MTYYVITQINAIGNGSSTTVALVTDPKIEGTSISATKVGEVDWDNSSFSHYVFKEVAPRNFIVIGNATCEECENPFQK